MKIPEWIGQRSFSETREELPLQKQTKALLRELSLHSVCEEAKCPNIGECFGQGTATFLILGDTCTRNCRFCGIKKGTPNPVDNSEPTRLAQAVSKLSLSHVVVTSVTRDDLSDGGASQFAEVVREIKNLKRKPELHTTIELLVPILDSDGLEKVISASPDVINHNVETVPRLYPQVRPGFNYPESLRLLDDTKSFDDSIVTKSGIMVGLGETHEEVIGVMRDLRDRDVDILTIGQYLRPSGQHVPVSEYIHPDQFREYEEGGYDLGFRYVASGPYVRSSYKAREAFAKCKP
jgi:lipoic acid synthetase